MASDQPPAWRGWLVVSCSFYCIAVLDGVGYTTGVMLDSLLRDLGGGRGKVSLVGSIQVTAGHRSSWSWLEDAGDITHDVTCVQPA